VKFVWFGRTENGRREYRISRRHGQLLCLPTFLLFALVFATPAGELVDRAPAWLLYGELWLAIAAPFAALVNDVRPSALPYRVAHVASAGLVITDIYLAVFALVVLGLRNYL
jgi:hypothetical protein